MKNRDLTRARREWRSLLACWSSQKPKRRRSKRELGCCIVERGVHIPENTQIGYDVERDRARGFTITETGLVVVGRPDADGGEESDTIAVLSAD